MAEPMVTTHAPFQKLVSSGPEPEAPSAFIGISTAAASFSTNSNQILLFSHYSLYNRAKVVEIMSGPY